MRTLKLILIKELKSMIRDPKILIAMILVPIVLTGIIYALTVGFMGQAVREALVMKGKIVIYNKDNGNWSRYVEDTLKDIGLTIYTVGNEDELISILKNDREVIGGIIIPENFSENISSLKPAKLYVYTILRSVNVLAFTRSGKITGIVSSIQENITHKVLSLKGIPEEFVEKNIDTENIVIVKNSMIAGKDLGSIIGSLVMTAVFIPLIIMILASFIAQLSATSIAVEKEEKMLETLLSLPLSRLQLIGGKILASTIIGFIGLILYGGLFLWYFSSISSMGASQQSSTESTTVTITVLSNILGGPTIISLIVSIIGLVLFVLGLATLLALFVEDVRSAQIISSYIIMPLALAIFLSLFIDPSTMDQATRMMVSLIPMVNIGFIVNMGFIGDNISLTLIPVSNIVYAIIVMYIASRIISTEKVFTIKLFKRRGRKGLRLKLLR